MMGCLHVFDLAIASPTAVALLGSAFALLIVVTAAAAPPSLVGGLQKKLELVGAEGGGGGLNPDELMPRTWR